MILSSRLFFKNFFVTENKQKYQYQKLHYKILRILYGKLVIPFSSTQKLVQARYI